MDVIFIVVGIVVIVLVLLIPGRGPFTAGPPRFFTRPPSPSRDPNQDQ